MVDLTEYWRSWVNYEWIGPEVPQITVELHAWDDEPPVPAREPEEDTGACCCGYPAFAAWWEEFQDLIEDDFEDLGLTQRLLLKDWLIQAYEAGREG